MPDNIKQSELDLCYSIADRLNEAALRALVGLDNRVGLLAELEHEQRRLTQLIERIANSPFDGV